MIPPTPDRGAKPMNCPQCGEPWTGFVCGACFWTEAALLPPRWWKRCVRADHDASIQERNDGRFEFFCGDCSRGDVIGEAKP